MSSLLSFIDHGWHSGQLMLILVFATLVISLILVRKLQQALQRSHARQSAATGEMELAELIPEAIIIIRDKEVVFANKAAMKLLDSEQAATIHNRLEAMVDIYILLISSQAWSQHPVQTTLNGRNLRLESSGTSIRWHNEPAMMLTLHEIPPEKEATDPDMLALLDEYPDVILKFNPQGKLMYANPAARDILPADITMSDTSVFDLLPDKEADKLRRQVLPEAEKRGHIRHPSVLRHPDGDDIPVLMTCIAHAHGNDTYFSLIAMDMRQWQSDQQRQERLRKADAINRLAGGVAHELNNALMIILGNTALTRSRLQQPEQASHCLNRIEETGRRMSQMCTQILTYAGRGHLEFSTFELNQWLHKNQLQIRRVVPAHIELEINASREELMLRADPGQLLRALANVLKNACEAIGDGQGRIAISIHRQLMDDHALHSPQDSQRLKTSTYACLTVRDNGCGMDHHVIEHIFDPFFTTKSAERGMGMNVVQGIIHSHRGEVFVHSLPHEGAEVQIFLPLVKNRESTRRLTLPARTHQGQRGLLIIEQDKGIRELCAQYLNRAEWRIYMADNRPTAWQAYRQHADEIDAVLLDTRLGDAMDCLCQLREQCATLPFLLMTSSSDQPEQEAFAHMPNIEFISKPFDAEELRQRLLSLEFVAPDAS